MSSPPTEAFEAPSRPSCERAVPAPRVLPTIPTAARLREGVKLTRGAARLHDLLLRLTGDVLRHRGHEVLPAALTFHIPAVGLALFLGYTPRHLARLSGELEAVGLIAYGAHAQSVAGRPMWDGSLWKVALVQDHAPKIRADEWKHSWRPDFGADYTGKTGVKAEMSSLLSQERGTLETAYQALKTRAAVQVGNFPPAVSSGDIGRAAILEGAAARIAGLLHLHPRKRPEAVTRAAAALSQALGEPGRRAQWAGVIWSSLKATFEGRAGLDHLVSAVLRMRADLVEGAPWKVPGAVLMARL